MSAALGSVISGVPASTDKPSLVETEPKIQEEEEL
jgi:hypothetical protein